MPPATLIADPARLPLGIEPYLSRHELALAMGVSERTVDRWVVEGLPHETWGLRSRKFLLSETVRWARTRDRRADERT